MRISKETGLVQQDVFDVIQKTLDYITEALSKGQDVELRNFGVFEVRLTKSRVGRNPHKPEHDVVIPARATVKFKSANHAPARSAAPKSSKISRKTARRLDFRRRMSGVFDHTRPWRASK